MRGVHSIFPRLRRLRAPLGIVAATTLVGGALLIGPGNSTAQPSTSTATSTTTTNRWASTSSTTSPVSASPSRNPNDFMAKTCAGEDRNKPSSTSAPASLAPDGHNGVDVLLWFAFQEAHEQAAKDGVELKILSGCRTFAQQQQLWRDAVDGAKKAGKNQKQAEEQATRQVAAATDDGSGKVSRHLFGRAIDIGPGNGGAFDCAKPNEAEKVYTWICKNIPDGKLNRFGLCRIYGNEVWHLELAPTVTPQKGEPLNPETGISHPRTADGKPQYMCPALLPDATHPRKDK